MSHPKASISDGRTSTICDRVVKDHQPREKKTTTVLSPREQEIVVRAAQGATDKEIADDLELSVATLRTYWVRVREKLGAVNRTHAIALASLDRPAEEGNVRTRLIESLCQDRVSHWVWQGRSRRALLDPLTERLFDLSTADHSVDADRMLSHVWAPDRLRFERYLSQGFDLRPMTPIEMRVGQPGDYRHLIRTVNLACHSSSDSTILLASTTIHVFS